MKLKILFISSWFPNRIEPTNGNFVQRHAESVALKNDVEVLHVIGDFNLKRNYQYEEEIINGIRTLIVYYKNTKFPPLNFFRRFQAYRKGFSKMHKPDLVHANIMRNTMLFAVWLKKRFKIPFVISEHWTMFLKENEQNLTFTQQKIAKYIAKNSNIVLPVSQLLTSNLKRLGFKNNFEVVGNVVNTDLFYPIKKNNDKFIFLHISNLVNFKNSDKIVEAVIELRKTYQNFELHIGGDGNLLPLQKIISEANAEHYIKAFGRLSEYQVAERMKNSNAFILFSHYETFSCVLLESISSGTPVISTKVGIAPEVVNINNGILISKDKEELLYAMTRMLNGFANNLSPHKMHQDIVTKYSQMAIAEQFTKVYQKVLKK